MSLTILLTTAMLVLTFPALSLSSIPCPLNVTGLLHSSALFLTTFTRCQYVVQAIRSLQSDYLRRTGFFLPPPESSFSCWNTIQSFINQYDIRSSCNIPSSSISEGCMNITTRQQFQELAPPAALRSLHTNCNRSSLAYSSDCALCATTLSSLTLYFTGPSSGKIADCTAIVTIYAASLSNHYDPDTARCLFNLDLSSSSASSGKNRRTIVVVLVSVFVVFGLLVSGGGFWVYLRFKRKMIARGQGDNRRTEMGLDSMNQSTTLIRFTLEEIKKATRNFNLDNIIGSGGYGNVYKGLLSDGTQVALKRFKNCSVARDASFTHEVEVIASVRHVNLVALRGYCTATTNLEGHQRIIVTDLMENGSLYDHLFGSAKKKLSWPIRQKIALGTARGLAYLHYGAQPSIIHRDIKASNILLDEMFEAKVADFGLTKFNPEGMTHMSTRVAGTMGYVAPEYALYGQLTERSDVFSFGVLLLELLSGRKALQTNGEGQPSALTDLAWSLVRNSRALDVVEDGMPEAGAPEVLEKYVLVAVLCSHPQLYARPTMDQVVKMLETDESVPSIMERPIPFIAGRIDIEKSAGSNSGQLCSPTGYQAYTLQLQSRRASNCKEEEGSSEPGTVSED